MNNQQIITETIEQMNEEREAAARQSIRQCLDGIAKCQENIRQLNEAMAAWKTKLAGVSFVAVTAADLGV